MRRRRFLIGGAAFLAAGPAGQAVSAAPGDPGVSQVVSVRDSAYSTVGQPPDERTAGEMIGRAVRALTGAASQAEAWKALLGGAKTVGLKPNCLAGRGVSSSPRFVHALARQILDSLPAVGRIVIWERSDNDLRRAGFEIVTVGRTWCAGNDRLGYHSDLIVEGSVGSLFARCVVEDCDALINVPVLKDHGIVGVSVGLKNYYGAVHNPNKYHLNRGDPYVADLNRVRFLREKNVLTLCEAYTAQYEGGPPFKPQWSWPAGMVLASRDPVALDRVGWRMIEEQRAAHKLPGLAAAGREPSYILTAADSGHRLGQADPARIKEVILEA